MTATSGPINWDTREAKPYFTTHSTALELGRDPDRDKRKRDPLLDSPSERSPLLDSLMDRALLRIVMTADGATMTLKADIIKGTSAEKGAAPRSSLAGELDRLGGDYNRAQTHRARLRVIKEAQDMASRLRYAPRAEMRGTVEWKMAIASDDRKQADIAVAYGITQGRVSQICKEMRAY